jgi:hypothetical protein
MCSNLPVRPNRRQKPMISPMALLPFMRRPTRRSGLTSCARCFSRNPATFKAWQCRFEIGCGTIPRFCRPGASGTGADCQRVRPSGEAEGPGRLAGRLSSGAALHRRLCTALKSRQALLDYDDLIAATASLLEKSGAGAWVHYKLDQGIDHILVDEAQDTAPLQWSVIGKLSEEFFAGEGARQDHPAPCLRLATRNSRSTRSRAPGPSALPRSAEHAGEGRVCRRHLRTCAAAGFVPLLDRSSQSGRSCLSPRATPAAAWAIRTNRCTHETARIRAPGLAELWPMIGKQKPRMTTMTGPQPSMMCRKQLRPRNWPAGSQPSWRGWIDHEHIEDQKTRKLRPISAGRCSGAGAQARRLRPDACCARSKR